MLSVFDHLVLKTAAADKLAHDGVARHIVGSERRQLSAAVESAKELGVNMPVGNLYSSDTFYDASASSLKWAEMGVLAIEMEAAALYCNAAYTKKRGLSICSISDNIVTGEELSPEQRQTSFTAMMKIALETAVKMAAL